MISPPVAFTAARQDPLVGVFAFLDETGTATGRLSYLPLVGWLTRTGAERTAGIGFGPANDTFPAFWSDTRKQIVTIEGCEATGKLKFLRLAGGVIPRHDHVTVWGSGV